VSRLEYKYLFHINDIDKLRRKMSFFIFPDWYGNHERGEYVVRSIYYDTPSLEYYFRKEAGFIIRKKIRLRGYDEYDPGKTVFFEIKRKLNNRIYKERIPVKFSNVSKFLMTGEIDREVKLSGILNIKKYVDHFLFHYHSKSLVPVILVTYDREAYYSKFNRCLRITFDKNLRAKLFPTVDELFMDSGMEYVIRNYFILEVKFYNSLPDYLLNVIGEFSVPRLALSKYVMSVDGLQRKGRLSFLPKLIVNRSRIARNFESGG